MKTELTTANESVTLHAMPKEELIYTRISGQLKNRLTIEAHQRGEAEAVIVREALNEYFKNREILALREPEPVSYKTAMKRRRK